MTGWWLACVHVQAQDAKHKMPMPNLKGVDENPVWALPPGPYHPWREDLALAESKGFR